jgi:solute carrier family 25 phosphate transporter 3
MSVPGATLLAPSPTDFSQYTSMYYVKGAAAGGICCSVTHGALTPVDVVKTRVQLDSVKVRS